jgi:N utilization substance protein A
MFLVKLFEVEVPEVQDGTIEIKAAAREPGHRAKIAVYTADRDIDPVGACVGMKGSRVQNIVNELQGEKIDIVKWSEDVETFARAALAPADIASIMTHRGENLLDVIVEDDQLSLAIGKKGQNVRLAAMLTSWKVNIISKTKLQERIKFAVQNLLQLDGLAEATAQVLVQIGIMSVVDLSASTPADISRVTGLNSTDAQSLINKAAKAIEDGTVKLEAEASEEIVSASAIPGAGFLRREGRVDIKDGGQSADANKFSEAERRLREELAAFKLK